MFLLCTYPEDRALYIIEHDLPLDYALTDPGIYLWDECLRVRLPLQANDVGAVEIVAKRCMALLDSKRCIRSDPKRLMYVFIQFVFRDKRPTLDELTKPWHMKNIVPELVNQGYYRA